MAEVRVEDIKPNSKSYKAAQAEKASEKPKISPVVNKSARVPQKDSFGKKFVKSFLADEVNDIKEYIIMDCIIPSVKSAILDMLSMSFFGERGRGSDYRRGDRYDYSSYYGRSSYSGRRDRDSRERDRRERPREEKIDYRNIVMYEKADAERVVGSMRARIRETGGVSISEMLALIGEPSNYTDTDYGWLDERDIGIRKVSSGFLIDVPEARYLN